ncbi:MAG: biotin synthase [Burkholderiaceae bacterium]
MTDQRPPTIDPVAALRWACQLPSESPWLHEEVARRMQERLQWIKLQPQSWAHWEPLGGGLLAHRALAQRYPRAACFVVEPDAARSQKAERALAPPWWRAARWLGTTTRYQRPQDAGVQMLWANMALHLAPDPQALIAQWQRALAPEGFLMFSCLGPDSLGELRALYRLHGWPPPAPDFTDMHDWGDMLVNAGFAEPVMDMERITLSFPSGARLLGELRGLGRNLHPARFGALRGRSWHGQLLRGLDHRLALGQAPTGPTLSFEIIYGHAIKAPSRVAVAAEAFVALDTMRSLLRQGHRSPARL